MFPRADEWVTRRPRGASDTQANVTWRGWADWKSSALNAAVTTVTVEQPLLCHHFVSPFSPYLDCAALASLSNCSICSKFFGCAMARARQAAFLSSQRQRFLYPLEDLFPPLGSPLWTHTNCFLAHSHFIGMVIYSIELFWVLLIVLFCTVLTCAVSACSSISSNSWYSSSSGSAPESRAARAMKYGGSSPMAVPAPWEKNNSDLFFVFILK